MTLTYRLTNAALDGLSDVSDFYDRQQYGLGDDVRAEVLQVVRTATAFPFLYGQIPRCPRGRYIQIGKTQRFKVLVVYEVTANEILVLSVVHASAHPRRWRRHLKP